MLGGPRRTLTAFPRLRIGSKGRDGAASNQFVGQVFRARETNLKLLGHDVDKKQSSVDEKIQQNLCKLSNEGLATIYHFTVF